MNKVILLGRLTKNPQLTSTINGISRCVFTIAVDRRFKNADGEKETDFIPVVAWRSTAEFVNKYFGKGVRIALVGSIQIRSWETDTGETRYITEVVADEVYFADGYQSNNNAGYSNTNGGNTNDRQGNINFFDEDDTELPFDL